MQKPLPYAFLHRFARLHCDELLDVDAGVVPRQLSAPAREAKEGRMTLMAHFAEYTPLDYMYFQTKYTKSTLLLK